MELAVNIKMLFVYSNYKNHFYRLLSKLMHYGQK